MDSNQPVSQNKDNNRLSISLSWRLVSILLLLAIAAMVAIWKPWVEPVPDASRVISVEGQAKVSAEPDEFVFNPSYEFKNKDKDKALAEVTNKSDEVVKKLKELGVADSKIKTDSSGYNYDYYFDNTRQENRYSLRLTVTAENREQAQKVQDYLITTGPMGSVSPQANFSDAKRKELEDKARDEATKDARSKADRSAANLGFKVGKVKSVEDGTGFGNNFYSSRGSEIALQAGDSAKSLAVQPGENDLSYTVKVIYYMK